jgi:hypothetical protein
MCIYFFGASRGYRNRFLESEAESVRRLIRSAAQPSEYDYVPYVPSLAAFAASIAVSSSPR